MPSERLLLPELEEELIKGVLGDYESPDVDLFFSLEPKDFSIGNRRTFEILRETYRNHGSLEPSCITTEWFNNAGSKQELARVKDLFYEVEFAPFGIRTMLETIMRAKKVNNAIGAVEGMVNTTNPHLADPGAISAQLRAIAEELETDTVSTEDLTLGEYWDRVAGGKPIVPLDRITSLVHWGIPTLDADVRSLPGSLGVIAAKTSAGKSSLALQAAIATANRGVKTLVLGLEMTRDELASRAMGQWLGCSAWDLSKGQHAGYDRPAWLDSLEVRDRIPHGGFDDACTIIRKHARNGTRVVFIDYWTLVRPVVSLKSAGVSFMLGEMSRGFKQLAKDTNTHIVLVSQFNREVKEAQRPTLENLRETGQLEQDASWVLMMWTEKERYEPGERRTVLMEVQKNRSGRRWVQCRSLFDPEIGAFAETYRETDPVPANPYDFS